MRIRCCVHVAVCAHALLRARGSVCARAVACTWQCMRARCYMHVTVYRGRPYNAIIINWHWTLPVVNGTCMFYAYMYVRFVHSFPLLYSVHLEAQEDPHMCINMMIKFWSYVIKNRTYMTGKNYLTFEVSNTGAALPCWSAMDTLWRRNDKDKDWWSCGHV